MACLVLGDSIAVGVGQNRPDCETYAQVGINSDRYISTLLPSGRLNVETAVISLGVNDDPSLDTLSNLREVRSRITGQTVYWLLPGLKERARSIIRTVAAENGDRLIDTRPEVGPDHLHPTGTGYRLIASMTYGGSGETEVAEFSAPAPHERHVSTAPSHRGSHLRTARHRQGMPLHAGALQSAPRRSMHVAARFGHTPPAAAHPSAIHLGADHLGAAHLGAAHLSTAHLSTAHLGAIHLGAVHHATRTARS